MDLFDLQRRIARRIREIPILATRPVFEEDEGNVVENVNQEIAQSFFCVVVGALSFSDEAPDSALCHGKAAVVVTIFEHPLVNRAQPDHVTYLKAAQAVAKHLKLFDTGDGVLTSPAISEPQDLGGGVISATVRLELKTTL